MKGMGRIGQFRLEEVLPLIGAKPTHLFATVLGTRMISVRMGTSRMLLMKRQQDCQCCGIQGSFFAMEMCGDQVHFNLYGINEHGHEVLMTVDHIKPRCRGGKSNPENLQVLCTHCNQVKGPSLISLSELRQLRHKHFKNLPNKNIKKSELVECRPQLICAMDSAISTQIVKLNITYQDFQLFHWNGKSAVIAQSVVNKTYDLAYIPETVTSLYDFMWLISRGYKPRLKFGISSLEVALALMQ